MTPSAEDIESQVGFLIRRCSQIATAIFFEQTAEYDITPQQYSALAFIKALPGIDQTGLSARSALDRSTITGVIDRLEARKLIERRVDPQNRRARLLYPTDEGTRLFRRVQAEVAQAQQMILAPLAVGERETFLTLIRKLVDGNNEQSRVPIRLTHLH